MIPLFRTAGRFLSELITEWKRNHCQDLPPGVSYRRESSGVKDQFGRRGEREAARYLRRRKYIILERNLVLPSCELDLIAWDRNRDELVFVEVKTRRSVEYGQPREAVDEKRQVRMRLAAGEYSRWKSLAGVPRRFDIIGIVWPEGEKPVITHDQAAFS